MQLISRDDRSLAIALIAATVIVFQQPLRFVLAVSNDIEARYHVDLVPALVLLVVVFVFHESQKRAKARADAEISAAESLQARMRAEELEQLMTFGQALANALDRPTIQEVVKKLFHAFAGGREFWVLTRQADRWELFVQEAAGTPSIELLDQLAARAIAPEGHLHGGTAPPTDICCFPLIAGGVPVGVAGLRGEPAVSEKEQRALNTAATLAAVSVRNVQLLLEARDLSARDALTGCFNQGHAIETIDTELRRARRSGRPLSILMCDVDRFKSINDTFGHPRGDEVLQLVAARLTKVLRISDVRCRYGGDEFLVVLPDTPAPGAEHVAESIRREVSTLCLLVGSESRPISVSIGLATAAVAEDWTPHALIERADAALYSAKRGGRNRVSGISEAPVLVQPKGGLSSDAAGVCIGG